MTTSADILDAVEAALTNTTDALDRVFRPGDWPSQNATMPQIKLRLLSEDRAQLARSGPSEFTTTATVRIVVEVSELALEDNAGAAVAEASAWAIKKQIDVAVVNSYPLTSIIQQIASIRSQLAFSADGATHLAGIQIDLAFEFFESAEDFAPVRSVSLAEVDTTATHYPPVAAKASLT